MQHKTPLTARRGLGAHALGLALVFIGESAFASSVINLNGSGPLSVNTQFLGSPNGNVLSPAGTGILDVLQVPGNYSFSDSFPGPQSNPLTGTSGSGSYSFQDSYQFSLPTPANGSVVTVSIDYASLLNISNLQFRVYEAASASDPATLGAVPSASRLVAWTTSNSATFTNAVSGTYFLDVAGTATGFAGGVYAGALVLQPVPVPTAGMLLGSVIPLLLFVRRRPV